MKFSVIRPWKVIRRVTKTAQDLEFSVSTTGPVITDRVDGKKYRLVTSEGYVQTEQKA